MFIRCCKCANFRRYAAVQHLEFFMSDSQTISLELLHNVTRDLAARMKELCELKQRVLEAEAELLRYATQPLGLAYAA